MATVNEGFQDEAATATAAAVPDWALRVQEQAARRTALNARRYETFKIKDRTAPAQLANDSSRIRSVEALRGFQPTRLRFEREHGEWDDDYWALLFADLYWRVREFAADFFHDEAAWPGDVAWSPWSRCAFPNEFVEIVEALAVQDPLTGGWDAVLTNPQTRSSLVVGVIARVLEEHVFQALLFGASQDEDMMLMGQDRATLDSEGYTRTALRAKTVQAALGPNVLPDNFWSYVDTVTVRLTALLLPLVQVLDEGLTTSASQRYPTSALHQEMHSIVAHAGYLAICMRRSPTIFRLEFPDPGQPWGMDMDHMFVERYVASRRVASVVDRAAKTRFDEQTSASGERDFYVTPMRMAKVHVCQWPVIKRFRAVGGGAGPRTGEDPTAQTTRGEGEWIGTIMKAQVLCYAGLMNKEEYVGVLGGKDAFLLNEVHMSLAGKTVKTEEGDIVVLPEHPLAAPKKHNKRKERFYSDAFPLEEHISLSAKRRGTGWRFVAAPFSGGNLRVMLDLAVLLSLVVILLRFYAPEYAHFLDSGALEGLFHGLREDIEKRVIRALKWKETSST